jgi:hypothetical protein
MLRAFLLFSFFILLRPFFIYSQLSQNEKIFWKVDSAARSVKYNGDIYQLTNELTNPYTEPILKVRSIFIWIADNVRYDYKFYNKGAERKPPKCKPGMDCNQLLIDWENAGIKKVLQKKKGVCDGYSKLFKKMCDIAGIPCEIITGYTKQRPYQVGITGPVNHAWNAVRIDTTWYFLDPTWAAGFCWEHESTSKLLGFQKNYNDYYWFTSFHDLARNHYPKDSKWVLEDNYTKEKFSNNPYYRPDILKKINLISPSSGIINAKKGDTIHFQFHYKDDIDLLQINSNIFRNPSIYTEKEITKRKKLVTIDSLLLKKQRYVPFKKNGDHYEFDYVVPDDSLYYLEILFEREMVMRFKVKIDKKD